MRLIGAGKYIDDSEISDDGPATPTTVPFTDDTIFVPVDPPPTYPEEFEFPDEFPFTTRPPPGGQQPPPPDDNNDDDDHDDFEDDCFPFCDEEPGAN
jgi:hypothetical protein